ncbi:hypothetical protein ACI8B_250078 [Acinetobacter proteolyticus]|uniref:Transposase n=1 Tax=Acinetobacter proteolyticus TaxID=1776741 RepID=A0A653K5Q8_9GAMM|nr:hypothetical protein ACI8B_250078 [Acinetobacter proteolyticus]
MKSHVLHKKIKIYTILYFNYLSRHKARQLCIDTTIYVADKYNNWR